MRPTQLVQVGLDEARWREAAEHPALRLARVRTVHKGGWDLVTAEGAELGQLAGKLRRLAAHDDGCQPIPGDWVLVGGAPGAPRIELVLPRRTVLARRAPGAGDRAPRSSGRRVEREARSSRRQLLVANLDLVLVVVAVGDPAAVRRAERLLALAHEGAIPAAVLLQKADLASNALAQASELSTALGVAVTAVSARAGEGLEQVAHAFREGHTVALLGASGVGKSSLVNALAGEARAAVGAVREADSTGRHTTTRRELYVLPGGAIVVDTPGLREVGLEVGDGLDTTFEDVVEHAAGCRFRDCAHQSEPGCAVRDAVARGELAAERLAMYVALLGEARG